VEQDGKFSLDYNRPQSIGKVKSFYGNFLVIVRALTYLLTLGKEGLPQVAQNAVLNANYLMALLKKRYHVAYDVPCMHEFVLSLQDLKDSCGVTAMDVAKSMQDLGMHPPTMYFPLIVHEALMIEPTETESKETLDQAAQAMLELYEKALSDPEAMHRAPETRVIGRPDEVNAARHPVVKYAYD
jgi:glycine dehydrogenase subunit 2